MDVSKLFKGQKLSVECPNCQKEISFDASLAFKSNSSIECTGCSKTIALETSNAKKSVEKAIKGFKL